MRLITLTPYREPLARERDGPNTKDVLVRRVQGHRATLQRHIGTRRRDDCGQIRAARKSRGKSRRGTRPPPPRGRGCDFRARKYPPRAPVVPSSVHPPLGASQCPTRTRECTGACWGSAPAAEEALAAASCPSRGAARGRSRLGCGVDTQTLPLSARPPGSEAAGGLREKIVRNALSGTTQHARIARVACKDQN